MKKLLLVFITGLFATSAWGDVTLRIQWQLNDPLSELQAFVKEGVALQARINPKVTHTLWVNVVHGENVNSASLVVGYEDLAHYAAATAREEANAEWNAFIARFDAANFPTTFTGLNQVAVGDGATMAKAGDALAIFLFATGGDVGGLTELVNQAAAIQGKVNPKAQISMVVPIVAGDSVGGAAVLTRYPSMVDWAEGGAKLQASEEWGKFIASFPADRYRPMYQGLSQAAAIR